LGLKNLSYNWCNATEEEFVMPKKKVLLKEGEESFGRRLAQLRQAAGYSQRELAAELGISYRMIAYYETEAARLPTHLLPQLAKVLGVTTDQLLGVEKAKGNGKRRDSRLWRRFSQVEKLPTTKRKQIVQILDAFLGSEKLKRG
jgi:transcriptional regulator with XRE-family HTH domain